jgi:hypothetical protein
MTVADPFAVDDNPWDEPTTNTDTFTEEKQPMTVGTDFEAYTITLKFGGGYDAPWAVIRAGDAETAKERIQEAQRTGLLEMIAKASGHVSTLIGDKPSGGGQSRPAPRPGGGSQAPAETVDGDSCTHGRRLVDKGSWAAKFCGHPDKSQQCEPLWRDKQGNFKAK